MNDFVNYTWLPLVFTSVTFVVYWKVFRATFRGINRTLSADAAENRTLPEIIKDVVWGGGVKLGRAVDSAFRIAVQSVFLTSGALMLVDRLGYDKGTEAVSVVFAWGITYSIITLIDELTSTFSDDTLTYYELVATHPTGKTVTFVLSQLLLKRVKTCVEKSGGTYNVTELGEAKPSWRRLLTVRAQIKQWEAIKAHG